MNIVLKSEDGRHDGHISWDSLMDRACHELGADKFAEITRVILRTKRASDSENIDHLLLAANDEIKRNEIHIEFLKKQLKSQHSNT